MDQNIDLHGFPFKDTTKNTLAMNALSSIEAERLFIETEGDDKIPYPFYFSWFGAMIEQLEKANDAEGINIVIQTLYNALGVDLPEIFHKIEESDFIARFADELFADFEDIACEEYSQ